MGNLNVRLFIVVVGTILIGGTALVQLAQPGRRRHGAALLAGWALPGAGHLVLGKWGKGLFFFSLLGATWLFGLWIVGFRSVDWDENPFYYVGQYGSGLTLLGAKALFAAKSFPRAGLPLSWYDPGLLYVCCAGLLNLVAMLSLIDTRPLAAKALAAPSPSPAPLPEKPAA